MSEPVGVCTHVRACMHVCMCVGWGVGRVGVTGDYKATLARRLRKTFDSNTGRLKGGGGRAPGEKKRKKKA